MRAGGLHDGRPLDAAGQPQGVGRGHPHQWQCTRIGDGLDRGQADIIQCRGTRATAPLGTFTLNESSPRAMILMGGGTGFAPLKGMLEHAFHIGLDRPIHLFCGVRERRDLYMDDMVRGWLEQHANLKYTPVLSEPEPGDNWQGKTGFVHEAIIEEYPAWKLGLKAIVIMRQPNKIRSPPIHRRIFLPYLSTKSIDIYVKINPVNPMEIVVSHI